MADNPDIYPEFLGVFAKLFGSQGGIGAPQEIRNDAGILYHVDPTREALFQQSESRSQRLRVTPAGAGTEEATFLITQPIILWGVGAFTSSTTNVTAVTTFLELIPVGPTGNFDSGRAPVQILFRANSTEAATIRTGVVGYRSALLTNFPVYVSPLGGPSTAVLPRLVCSVTATGAAAAQDFELNFIRLSRNRSVHAPFTP